MASDLQVLVDNDAFVGRFYPDDSQHKKASRIFGKLQDQGANIATTSLVVAETATVLSHRSGLKLARKFLYIGKVSKLPVIHIDEVLQRNALSVFKHQKKKGTSFTECANVVVMNRFKIPKILSFDDCYSKNFGFASPQ